MKDNHTMIVELHGVNFRNKGAELMLLSAVQHLKSCGSIATAELRCGSFQERANSGLWHLGWIYSEKIPWVGPMINTSISLLPRKLRNTFHFIRRRDVAAVLDASGFVLGDQRGTAAANYMGIRIRNWKKQGKKVILLPQAFGPFTNSAIRELVMDILSNVDLVFARDEKSYQHISEVGGQLETIHISPDFTCLLEGQIPKYFNINKKRACIIPNYRMLDQVDFGISQNYIPYLVTSISILRKHGFEPFFLLHELNQDHEIVNQIQNELTEKVEVVNEPNPIYLKGIIGSCSVVIGSRYHGLVSALSQNVPAIGTGWSHKYPMLFEEYGVQDLLVSPSDSEEILTEKILLAIEEPSKSLVTEELRKGSNRQKLLAKEMWSKVFDTISANNVRP
jgi:polysaccharide pyruvyl transferase WcaK-like protein